jgi:hypothetical protein
MRHQTAVGRSVPAGSGRHGRLDPFTLPVRFAVTDRTADQSVREVELTHERVVLRRTLHGIKMAFNLPLTAYLGVALHLEAPVNGQDPANDHDGVATIVLEHRDSALALPLFRTTEGSDIIAEWQTWGRVLHLPLLVADADGTLREPFQRIGAVQVADPIKRRRRCTAIKARRPRLLMRRRIHARPATVVYRDEREIIARN